MLTNVILVLAGKFEKDKINVQYGILSGIIKRIRFTKYGAVI